MSLKTTLDSFSKLPSSKRHAITLAALSVLVLRGRLLQLPQELVATILDKTSHKHRVSKEEVEQAIQQLYEKGPDGSKLVLVPHAQGISKVH